MSARTAAQLRLKQIEDALKEKEKTPVKDEEDIFSAPPSTPSRTSTLNHGLLSPPSTSQHNRNKRAFSEIGDVDEPQSPSQGRSKRKGKERETDLVEPLKPGLAPSLLSPQNLEGSPEPSFVDKMKGSFMDCIEKLEKLERLKGALTLSNNEKTARIEALTKENNE